MIRRAFGLLAVTALSASGLAQGTITDGSVSLSNGFTTPFSTNTGNANLTGVAPVDPVFHMGWGYRQTSNFGANTLMGNFGVQGQSYVGNTSTITYLNNGSGPAGVARFNAVIRTRLEDTVAGARIFSDVTITNTNSTTLVLDLFQVVDWDLNGTSGSDTAQLVSNVGGITLSQTEASQVASLYSDSANRFAAASGFTLRTIESSGTGNFANTALFTGDAALGLQWTLTIAAGQSVTIRSISAFGEVVPAPASMALLGLGGFAAARRRRG